MAANDGDDLVDKICAHLYKSFPNDLVEGQRGPFSLLNLLFSSFSTRLNSKSHAILHLASTSSSFLCPPDTLLALRSIASFRRLSHPFHTPQIRLPSVSACPLTPRYLPLAHLLTSSRSYWVKISPILVPVLRCGAVHFAASPVV